MLQPHETSGDDGGTVTLRFLGVAGFEILAERSRVLVDPFLSGNPASPVSPDMLATPDVILVTHAAPDHLGDAATIAQRTGAPVVCGADTRLLLLEQGVSQTQVRPVVWGLVSRQNGVLIRPVECHHWSMVQLPDGQHVTGTPLAFVVEPRPGVRIYHWGDTSIFDMRLIGDLYRPTIGIVGCSHPAEIDPPYVGELLTGELSPDEAARIVEMLGVQHAIGCHYVSRNTDADEFERRVEDHDTSSQRRVYTPEPGDTITINVTSEEPGPTPVS